ncbi:MAG: tetratricopeptide repeat protein [Salinivirgaceae bacterium]|jgi:tetratricopeptide (TPR) repeat protein|nr:tetratricopeptide repeat protein [Salinivirgaceae bacterium]
MMKRVSFLLLLLLLFFTSAIVFAQGGKVNSAFAQTNAGILDKAKEAIDLAAAHERTIGKAKTWKVRGFVYQSIAVSEDSSYAELCDNPVKVSLEAYKKALELDLKKKYSDEINKNLTMFTFKLGPMVSKDWENKDFKSAFYKFEHLIHIAELMDPPVIDSASLFNAGIAGEKAGFKDEAILYFQRAADLKYGGDNVYLFMANIELERGDSAKYVEILKTGIDAYPTSNKTIMSYLINYYININEAELALEYLKKAIEGDPTNETFYFAQGVMYDKLGEFDNAVASYEKSIETKADYHDGYYNLGALYVNSASEMLKEASNIPPSKQDEYEAAKKEAFVELEKALPSLEKAHELDATEPSTLAILKEIYFKLRNESDAYMVKYKEFQKKLDATE